MQISASHLTRKRVSLGEKGSGECLSVGPPKRKLGNLVGQADQGVAEAILQRGGSAGNVRQTGPWADKTLAETAEAAVSGDRTAETAIKIVKQARRLGQQH